MISFTECDKFNFVEMMKSIKKLKTKIAITITHFYLSRCIVLNLFQNTIISLENLKVIILEIEERGGRRRNETKSKQYAKKRNQCK